LAAQTKMVLALAMAVALPVAGCGGGADDSSGATGAPRLSKPEYIKRVGAMCRREEASLPKETSEFVARERRRGKPPALVNGEWAHSVLVAMVERQIYKMERLPSPPEEEPAVDAMLNAQRLAIDNVVGRARFPSMAAVHRYFLDADYQYEAFGLLACANGPKRQY
jgi:hypothetical protein